MSFKLSTICKIAAAIGSIVAFILLLMTQCCYVKGFPDFSYSGTCVIFGGRPPRVPSITAVPIALFSWIVLLIVILLLGALLVGEFLNINVVNDYGKYVMVGIAGLLIIVGILIFCTPLGVNDQIKKYFGDMEVLLYGGWIAAAILSFVSSLVCLAPLVLDFLGIEL